MASMREIKRRRASIQSTGQITRAMKLVATVRLQRARERAAQGRPYSDAMYRTVQSILSRTDTVRHPFLQGGGSERKAVIVMTSNRGLAGGYNHNVVRLITHGPLAGKELDIYAIGRKGRDALSREGYLIRSDGSDAVEEPSFSDALAIGRQVLQDFRDGRCGEVWLAYTFFKNTVVHLPRLVRLLPVTAGETVWWDGSDSPEDVFQSAGEKPQAAELRAGGEKPQAAGPRNGEVNPQAPGGKGSLTETEEQGPALLMNFEEEEEQVLDVLVPAYVNSLIYGALLESCASENGARMQAMDSATDNAEEMIEDLTLLYNRARQGSITQELTEIIAGANAIG